MRPALATVGSRTQACATPTLGAMRPQELLIWGTARSSNAPDAKRIRSRPSGSEERTDGPSHESLWRPPSTLSQAAKGYLLFGCTSFSLDRLESLMDCPSVWRAARSMQ